MLELETALDRILAEVAPAGAERIPLSEACGRFLAEHVTSGIHLPPFDNSVMDGYAVRAADTAGANPAAPRRLRIAGKAAAGSPHPGRVEADECVRLFTGSAMPAGTDAVVMQEDTLTDPATPDAVSILSAVEPGENVRFRGEDVSQGTLLSRTGQRLEPAHLALFAATGMQQVSAGLRPNVAVLATGSELVEAGRPLEPGQIYESNRIALSTLISRAGGEPKTYPIVKDTLEGTRLALDQAFEECDLVITSGGVSVGEMDFVKSAFQQGGGTLEFWKVAVKPGRPFVFGRRGSKLLFGLPGNPVSASVTFLLLVRPALLKWQGAADLSPAGCSGILAEPLANEGSRRHFLRVTLTSDGQVHSSGLQASHALGSFAAANGLVDVPPNTTLAAGTQVRVLRWD